MIGSGSHAGLWGRALPAGLPVLPSTRLAVSYLPAGGGNWFDAVALADGRIGLVVGDVVGHGGEASADTGLLREVLRDRLADTGDVRAAVEAAHRAVTRMSGAYASTVCVALLDPETGALVYCTAGHPPPLLVGAGEGRYLPVTGAPPLGVGSDFAVATASVGVGEVVLLYTDGIVERPGYLPSAATVDLCRVAEAAVAGAAPSAVDRACAWVLELARDAGSADDATVLAAQRVPRTPPLHLRLPARTDREKMAVACDTRAEMGRWLRAQAVGEDDAADVVLAVSELVTNAVEHSGAGTEVAVDAELAADGVAEIAVADDGRWCERGSSPRHHRGHGLVMTADLVDRVAVDRGSGGTTVTVRRRLSHPATLLAGIGRTPPSGEDLRLHDRGDDGVALFGPLDAGNARGLAREIGRRTFGGTHPLTVDLTGVTHLAGAAVAVLHRAAARGAANAAPLRVHAPPSTLAQHVCALVRLPHTTGPQTIVDAG